jgi:hypothetical protein
MAACTGIDVRFRGFCFRAPNGVAQQLSLDDAAQGEVVRGYRCADFRSSWTPGSTHRGHLDRAIVDTGIAIMDT